MDPKLYFLPLFLFICFSNSWVFAAAVEHGQQGGGGGSPLSSLPCMQKLLPCQPYLGSPTAPPPQCCLPLKGVIADDTKCLCDIFDNPEIMKSLNITKEQALKLPKACGADADISLCKTGDTPTASPATPSAPASSSNGSNSTASAATKNAVNVTPYFGRYCSIAFFVALIISAF